MPEKKVLAFNFETGHVVVDSRGMGKTLTGRRAIRQNILLRTMAQYGQGYLGVLWRKPFGLRWRRLKDLGISEDNIPGLFGEKQHPAVVAMHVALEAARASGVRRVTHAYPVESKPDENRHVEIVVKALVGDENFPVSLTVKPRLP